MKADEDVKLYRVPINKMLAGRDVFVLHTEKGMPIEFTAMLAKEQGMAIDWAGFISRAVDSGFNKDNIINRCRNASKDAGYDDDFMSSICMDGGPV